MAFSNCFRELFTEVRLAWLFSFCASRNGFCEGLKPALTMKMKASVKTSFDKSDFILESELTTKSPQNLRAFVELLKVEKGLLNNQFFANTICVLNKVDACFKIKNIDA